MGIISKTVKVFPRGKAVAHYKEKGYDAKYGQELEVKVDDLLTCSTVLIEVECDYCNQNRRWIKYVNYNAQTKNGTRKCCCLDCAYLKQEETMIEKYGYKSPLQVPEIKNKFQKTNQERYGSNSPAGNAAVREKQKKTLMENYGVEHPSQSKEVQDKIKQTCLERYGVENVLLNDNIKEKIKQTNLERYGVENVLLNKEIRNKRDATLIENFGTLYPLQNEECLEKMKRTNAEKYGVEFISQTKEVKEKVRQTSLERYGVNNPSQNEEVKEKIEKTNLEKYGVKSLLSLSSFHEHSREVDMERYGVYHHLQNPEILAKQKETFYQHGTCPTSKQQTYLCKLYQGELNYPLMMYSLDIYLPNEKIDIEFDGSGHRLSCQFGSVTEEEFKRKEIIRNSTIKNAGIRTVRIISSHDYLPSDTILLQMLETSKQYFLDYPDHSWIEYNIDDSTIRNAEHKNGVSYDFGELRKINKVTEAEIEYLI